MPALCTLWPLCICCACLLGTLYTCTLCTLVLYVHLYSMNYCTLWTPVLYVHLYSMYTCILCTLDYMYTCTLCTHVLNVLYNPYLEPYTVLYICRVGLWVVLQPDVCHHPRTRHALLPRLQTNQSIKMYTLNQSINLIV